MRVFYLLALLVGLFLGSTAHGQFGGPYVNSYQPTYGPYIPANIYPPRSPYGPRYYHVYYNGGNGYHNYGGHYRYNRW